MAITFLIAPLAPLVLSSIQSEKTLQGDTRSLLPREYTVANFRLILSAGTERGPIFQQVSYLPKSVERFPTAFLNSLVVGVAVTLIALVLASLSAYTIARLRVRWTRPLLQMSAMSRMVPLIVLWFGFKVPAKVIIVFLFMVFPILINTYQGVKDVDRNLQEVARSFCSSEAQLWRHLIIPSALPFIVVGIRLAIGRGLVGMIVSEFYTSVTGLGYMIVRYANAFETDKLFVPIVVVMVLGVGLMSLAKWFERRIAPWRNFDERE